MEATYLPLNTCTDRPAVGIYLTYLPTYLRETGVSSRTSHVYRSDTHLVSFLFRCTSKNRHFLPAECIAAAEGVVPPVVVVVKCIISEKTHNAVLETH